MFTIPEIRPTANIQSEEARQKYITQMNQLRNSPGWKLLVKDIEVVIEIVKPRIYAVGENELKYTERDLLVLCHNFLDKLIACPENAIRLVKTIPGEQTESFDPYEN